jgi:hypothetical protein
VNRRLIPWLVGFVIGLVGWLGTAVLRLPGDGLWVAAIAIGVVAAAAAGRPMAWPALLLGMVVAYPSALALGVIAFLGENWALHLILFLGAATAGFAGWFVVGSVIPTAGPRPS